jgi:hypothetical protein
VRGSGDDSEGVCVVVVVREGGGEGGRERGGGREGEGGGSAGSPSMLMVVVLPAPLGPSMPKHSPWPTPMVRVRTATLAGLPMYDGYTWRVGTISLNARLEFVQQSKFGRMRFVSALSKCRSKKRPTSGTLIDRIRVGFPAMTVECHT